MAVAKAYQDQLDRIKQTVERARQYFQPNIDRYHEFRYFVFKTTMTSDDQSVLKALQKPQIEFNILEAYISRLRGEWSKQEPSINVMAEDGSSVDVQTLRLVEGHLRHILCEANKDSFEYEVYTDLLSGGFSVMKVWTEYSNEMSFDQNIKIGRVFDPTLTGFDPLARLSHKGDGRFCYELFPKTKEEFKTEYPKVDMEKIKFTRHNGGFNWSYMTEKEDEMLLICDYYEKKKKRVKIYKLSNGKSVEKDKYEEYMAQWESAGHIEQPATPVKERWTEKETICRYRFIENEVIEYIETDFNVLPLIFVSGNSMLLRESGGGAVQEMTRPYIYNAKGVQKLKNFAGQTLANELENMVQHKLIVAKEAIPLQYQEAYQNVQIANVLVFNAFRNDDPNVPLPPPREFMRVPTPPEVTNTFTMADQITQTILGAYDASLGINDNQLSGVAIVEGATQSNSAAMPFVVGFMQALTQLAKAMVDLIPKYVVTPRTLPIVGVDGRRSYIRVNENGAPNLRYSMNALNVNVEAGVNFAIQKNKALNNIIQLTKASPQFAQFINDVGLEVILDNVEIRGIDQLKELAKQWMQKQQQMQQQQAQMQQEAMKNNPMVIKAQAEQMKAQSMIMEAQHKIEHSKIEDEQVAAENAVAAEKEENNRLDILSKMMTGEREQLVREEKLQTERMRSAVDLLVEDSKEVHKRDMDHRTHAREDAALLHKMKGE